MCRILINAGAEVTGYSLEPVAEQNLFSISRVAEYMKSIIGDVRDLQNLQTVFNKAQPEIVLHFAAQPIVREGYKNPVYTYETNVIGTVNLLECVRNTDCVRSFLNITTDKVYKNNEWEWGYRENEQLGGFDPYSNSKSCSEFVTQSYRDSFFTDRITAISTARAGNVIGGGDFAPDRIIPDCVRAAQKGENVIVRNPHSTRPYQHVLEPLGAYLLIAQGQYENRKMAGCYNVGPNDCDCITTGNLTEIFCNAWGEGITWENQYVGGPHEANFLKLDCSKLKAVFGWKPQWDIKTAVEKTVEWTKEYLKGGDMPRFMDLQIKDYMERINV